MKVLIIGMRNEHHAKLKQSFPKLKITLVSVQDNNERAGNKSSLFDVVISMYRFCSHNVERHCSNHPNYHRVTSYSHAKKLLQEQKL